MATQARGLDPCPCGGLAVLAACCGPLLAGRPARTAEELMRSRYTAFAVGDLDHLVRSWHPRTRPFDLHLPSGRSWLGLQVLEVAGGGPEEEVGTVSFAARYEEAGRTGVQQEVGRFERRRGAWVYLDALG